MLVVDGFMGEGGGQILRSSLALSLCSGSSFRITNLRAGRKRPGLRRQHLASVQAAAEIGRAKVEGAALGSKELTFVPSTVQWGDFHFDIGTAGSTTLLLQSVLPALMKADGPSQLVLEGGTHNPLAPPFDFLQRVFLPIVNCMGPKVDVQLERVGFYPKGGGIISQYTKPVEALCSLKPEEPNIKRIRGISLCGALPEHVAIRQANSAKKKLSTLRVKTDVKPIVADPKPVSPGSFVCIWAEGDNVFLGADSLGARGKPSETVGEEAADKMVKEVRSGAHLDRHTCDHMILPVSLAEGSSVFRTSLITLHTLTAIEIAKVFTDAKFKVTGREGEPGTIRVEGIGLRNQG